MFQFSYKISYDLTLLKTAWELKLSSKTHTLVSIPYIISIAELDGLYLRTNILHKEQEYNIHHDSSYKLHLIYLSIHSTFNEIRVKIHLGLPASIIQISLKNLIQIII
jgi:hypothetical protein